MLQQEHLAKSAASFFGTRSIFRRGAIIPNSIACPRVRVLRGSRAVWRRKKQRRPREDSFEKEIQLLAGQVRADTGGNPLFEPDGIVAQRMTDESGVPIVVVVPVYSRDPQAFSFA